MSNYRLIYYTGVGIDLQNATLAEAKKWAEERWAEEKKKGVEKKPDLVEKTEKFGGVLIDY